MDEDHSGGGIYFGGFGSLELANTVVSNNQAGYGGGIDMSPSGGHADLTLDGDTLILENTALVSGGGIRIEGDTRLNALKPNTLIEGNHAQGGYGGGIEVIGPASAAIGSPGYGTLGVIYFNDAQYGGGIAVLAQRDGSGTAYVDLFTTDPLNPVQISSNSASIRGGAIYMQPFTQHVPDDEGLATVCASDFRIDDNIAPEGAAVYADFDSDVSGRNIGSSLYLNESDECGETMNGAVACAPGVPCNEMAQNTAEDDSGQPTDGAVILLDSTSSLNANRFILRGNMAAYGINFVGANENGYGNGGMANCLIADNHTQHELIGLRRTESTTFAVGRCTLANNTIDNGYALYANENATFSFANNIVDMPGVLTLDYTGAPGNLNLGYILSNDISTLPVDTVIQGEPTFVDAANGDYHLQPTSLGVDFAPGVGGLDLDRSTRTVDLPDVPNVYGPLDLGAYEIQVDTVLSCANADTIYCDGFDG
jgi:predicted outer membrane repeat protein